MKKISLVLLTFSILSSAVWADCPKKDTITIENDHYVAYDQYGSKWVDVNPSYGHKLPVTRFLRAMGIRKGGVESFATRLNCAYATKDGHLFSLDAPDEQIYTIGESPYWEIENVMYVCSYRENESDCPFKPYT